jgi:hypothetical protein
MTETLKEYAEKHNGLNGADWLRAVQAAQSITIGGDPARVQKNFDGEYGGYFLPIAADMNAALSALFPKDNGTWVQDYLKKGTLPADPQKQAFVKGLDRWMGNMLNGQFPSSVNPMVASSFISAARDQTYTAKEHATLLNKGNFSVDLDQMGPHAMPFVLLTGGITQGILDFESRDSYGVARRYDAAEFKPFLSSAAKANVQQSNGNLMAVTALNRGDIIAASTMYMEAVCGAPSKDPQPLPRTAQPVISR